MKAFQQILNQPNLYLIQFDLAWQNLQAVEREFKLTKRLKMSKSDALGFKNKQINKF